MKEFCKNHPDLEAKRKCFQCKSPICSDCQIIKAHHIFCSQSCYRQHIIKQLSTTQTEIYEKFENFFLLVWKKIKTIEVFKKDLFSRQKFELQKIKTNDEFLRFIQDQIIDDLPIFICEGLDKIDKYASLIYKPKLTISYVSHVHNELYKYWVLDNNLNKKSANIGVHHGGDHQILDVLLNYNRLFCDYNYISWTKNKTSDINLPISKYVFPFDFNTKLK